jgi:EAL domain-containing protein (putative c-di-GMP-specific phosphodiesterase class I)
MRKFGGIGTLPFRARAADVAGHEATPDLGSDLPGAPAHSDDNDAVRFEGLPAAVIVIDSDGYVELANASAGVLLGAERDALIGTRVTELFEQDAEALLGFVAAGVPSRPRMPLELTCGGRDGIPHSLEARLTPVKTADGKLHAAAVLRRTLDEQPDWARLIRASLSDGRLVAFSQPIVSVDDNAVVGYELLARIDGNRGATYRPADFLPVAERTGLICDIDRAMIAEAIARIAADERAGGSAGYTVNVSARSIADHRFIHAIAHEVARAGVAPASLVLELRARDATTYSAEAAAFAAAARRIGLRLGVGRLEDWETSVALLEPIPVDDLKLSADLLKDMLATPEGRTAIEHLRDRARRLAIRTIVDRVQDEDALTRLTEAGFTFAQGNLLGPPARIRGPSPADPESGGE